MNAMLLAQADQAHAKEREFDRKAQKVGAAFVYLMLAVGGYGWLAFNGVAPAPAWAPISSQTSYHQQTPPLDLPPAEEAPTPEKKTLSV